MKLSLRARLLLGMIGLVAAGLTVAGAATYERLSTFLTERVDSELMDGRLSAVSALVQPQFGGGDRGAPQNEFPQGTYVALYDPSSHLIVARTYTFASTTSVAAPSLPSKLPNAGPDQPTLISAPGTGGVQGYRVLVESLDQAGGDFLVLAVPLTEVQSTLGQLLLLEGVVGALVLLLVAVLGWWIIGLGLRPLRRMGDTAAAIAAGDLSRRVETANPSTEIGRFGLALNAMLTQIESAFNERLRTEQRLRGFATAASHELRTPLTSIRGYAEMLRRGAADSPEDAEVARRRIEQESVRMTQLVEDLLLLARLDHQRPLERDPVRLDLLAEDAAADARAMAPGREVTVSSTTPALVTGDESRLRQVITNLVRNALVHTPAQTPVEMAVTVDGGYAVFSVADHGPGLSQEEMQRVFEPFYRADPARARDTGGTGLGLAIVAAVVSAHGGVVRAATTAGGGATFSVHLPLAATPAPESAGVAVSQESPSPLQ
ncbi:MAG: sensor histidine kinase [Candidatus Dormibacteria bacterium]